MLEDQIHTKDFTVVLMTIFSVEKYLCPNCLKLKPRDVASPPI